MTREHSPSGREITDRHRTALTRRELLSVGALGAIAGCNGRQNDEPDDPTATPNRRVSVTFHPAENPEIEFDGRQVDAFDGVSDDGLSFEQSLTRNSRERHTVRFTATNRREENVSYCPSWWWLYYREQRADDWRETRHGALYASAEFLEPGDSHTWGVIYSYASNGVDESAIERFDRTTVVYRLPVRPGEYLFGIDRFDSVGGDSFAVLSRFEIQRRE